MYSVSDETRKPIFEGVQGENEAREIQFDVTAWIEELGEGVCTATAKRPTDTTPYPVTVTRSGNVVTWKPNSTDTSIEGIGAFQLSFSIDSVVAKTRIWNTKIAPSLVGAGDPPDPYDDWIQDLRDIAAETLTYSQNAENSAEDAEAWAVGQRGGVDVPSTDETYHNNAKYYAEQSAANQYGAYIVKSASGAIASFTDGADGVPMKSLKVTIVPKQAGSGDPSPSNVRPISGWTDADVFVAGTNLWDEVTEAGRIDLTNGQNMAEAGKIRAKNYIPVKPSTQYYKLSSLAFWNVYYDENKNFIKYDDATAGWVFTTPSNCCYMRFYFESAYGTTYKHDTSINYPSTERSYHPYAGGHTTPVPLGQTVYGGELNPISGELVIDRALVDGGSYNWTYWVDKTYYVSIPNKTATATDDIQSDIYPSKTVFDSAGANGIMCNTYTDSIKKIIYITDNDVADAAALKTKLTGHQICYRINNPTTVQLTPTQVASLLGTNNVWVDCGSVAVEYRADPTLAYNELANVIVSLGGNL